MLLNNCTVTNLYKKVYVLDSKKDKAGRIIYKKIRQLHKTQTGDKNIITYQEFDSLGRKIREYGFQSPGSLSKYFRTIPDTNDKYLYEFYYIDNFQYLYNGFIWPTKIDSNFTPCAKYLVQQSYRPDSAKPLDGSIEINILKRGDSISIGRYQKFKFVSEHQYTWAECYNFKILTSKMEFDTNGIFKIKNAMDTFDVISAK